MGVQVCFSQQPDGTHVIQTDSKYFITNAPFKTYTEKEWEQIRDDRERD